MKLGWYINRLRSMGPAEIGHRVVEAGRKRRSRGRHEGWARYPAGPLPALPLLREAVRRADEPMRAAIAAAARRVVDGEFEALGRTWPADAVRGFPATLWRFDPVTGGCWPGFEAYTHDIDFRHDGSRGDVKYVWEINRLQQLIPLSAHAALAGDAEALAAIEAIIASWHEANPPFRGVGWASGIEVALRAISLVFVATLVGDRLSGTAREQLGRILTASEFWLRRFPSRHSSANNHRVAELAGLYLIGLSGGRAPAEVRAELVAETLRQILPDGAGAEQTPTYAAFTAELALLCALAARGAGAPFPPEFDTRLGAFATFVGWLGGDGTTPAIGDDDEGRVLTLLSHEADYPRSIAGAIAGYLGAPGPGTGDFRALLFGTPSHPAPPPAGLRTFADGGLSVWHCRQNGRAVRLTFDHGPLGYLSIAAHGHADALSLTLSLDGEPVLVDPGTYLYGSGGDWRRWFRSTHAHNTLNLGGVSQSTMSGPFNWSEKASARLEETGDMPSPWLRATHDGYRRRFGRTVQRTLELEAGRIAVTDQLLGGPPLPAELVFQLPPGLTATPQGRSVTVWRGADALLRLEFPTDAIALATGQDGVDGGWASPRFGERVPATRLSWRGAVGEGAVTTWLTPLGEKASDSALDTHPAQT
ncbi:MAG: alginate lyase family protein [Devosia sp.]